MSKPRSLFAWRPSRLRASLRPPLVLVALMILAGGLTTACGTKGGREEPSFPAPRSYTVDGEVVRLNAPDSEPREAMIRHQAIPDFVGIDGEIVGMEAMAMSFPLDVSVSAEGLEPGDRIRFTFEMDWQGSPPYRITEIEPLD